MKLVILESPYAGDIDVNVEYGRKCMRDCLVRGEAPYASHLLYTQAGVLNDRDPEERKLGMEAGFEWAKCLAYLPLRAGVVVYTDLGISKGMQEGISRHQAAGLTIEYRSIGYPLIDLVRGR